MDKINYDIEDRVIEEDSLDEYLPDTYSQWVTVKDDNDDDELVHLMRALYEQRQDQEITDMDVAAEKEEYDAFFHNAMYEPATDVDSIINKNPVGVVMIDMNDPPIILSPTTKTNHQPQNYPTAPKRSLSSPPHYVKKKPCGSFRYPMSTKNENF